MTHAERRVLVTASLPVLRPGSEGQVRGLGVATTEALGGGQLSDDRGPGLARDAIDAFGAG